MGVATSLHHASVAASAACCLLSPTPLSANQPSQMAFQAQVLDRPVFGQMETPAGLVEPHGKRGKSIPLLYPFEALQDRHANGSSSIVPASF
jgi:hypothetical protein